METAQIQGTLTDFGLVNLAPYSPEIIFTASGPGVSGSRILATRSITAYPSNTSGYFAVDLAPTEDLRPIVWYTIRIQWLNQAGGYNEVDFPDWKLFVPTSGGNLGDLLTVPSNPAQVWVGTAEPDNPTPGLWWLNPSTGDLKEWN